jgi:hypothetical protein
MEKVSLFDVLFAGMQTGKQAEALESGSAMNTSWNLIAAALLATSLGGCMGGGNYYAAQPGPNHPFSNSALSDEVFLDGTGQTSRRAGSVAPTRYEAATIEPGAPTRAVARSRPLAIEREARSDAVSGTTGARGSTNNADKPFSEAWWQREKLEDARLKAKMDICRGC